MNTMIFNGIVPLLYDIINCCTDCCHAKQVDKLSPVTLARDELICCCCSLMLHIFWPEDHRLPLVEYVERFQDS